MRLLVFDWTAGGHHDLYVRRVAEALTEVGDVCVAAPDSMELSPVRDAGVEVMRLGPARPAPDFSRPLGPQNRRHGEAEVDLLVDALERSGCDEALHLYADPVLRRLVRRPPLPCRLGLVIFTPRWHYPPVYGSPLGPRERARAGFQELLVRRWRRRPDAGPVFTLDEEAARRWGGGAHWFPEPPVGRPPSGRARRYDVVVYGALARRKGIHLLADAIVLSGAGLRILLAGSVEDGYRDELLRHVSRMTGAGAVVELRDRRHTPAEGLAALAEAKCVVLPYPRHYGMSRVLVEAAAVGTPIVCHGHGLLGWLVRRHGLGLAVDCEVPARLGVAISTVVDRFADPSLTAALERFAARFSERQFRQRLTTPYSS